jgi:bifunctional non-homologous end joining protein LigD
MRGEVETLKKIPFRVTPMLATLEAKPFSRANWIYEEKYDGVRMLAYKEGLHVQLISRNSIDRTERYPKIAEAIRKLKAETIALDGEIVVFDSKHISRFQMLQQGKGEPEYAVFDCLFHEGKDLRRDPLRQRRKTLEGISGLDGRLFLSAKVGADGVKAFQIARKRGYEGIVCKNLDSVYESRRSREWLKVKVQHEQEFVIGGYTKPQGARTVLGALLIGVYTKKGLHFAGKVGTGFDEETLKSLRAKLRPLLAKESPFLGPVKERDVTFVKPKLVAQISFTEWTKDEKLRHPVYLGLRDDKQAREVRREG